MIIQNLGDGNSNKQTGQHLKHFALFNLMNIHLNQMTLSLISLISYLKLLIRQYQNPRSVLNQENLGLMMNVKTGNKKNVRILKKHLGDHRVIQNYPHFEFIGLRLYEL